MTALHGGTRSIRVQEKGGGGAGRHFTHIATANSPTLATPIRHKHGAFYDGTAALNTYAKLSGWKSLQHPINEGKCQHLYPLSTVGLPSLGWWPDVNYLRQPRPFSVVRDAPIVLPLADLVPRKSCEQVAAQLGPVPSAALATMHRKWWAQLERAFFGSLLFHCIADLLGFGNVQNPTVRTKFMTQYASNH